MGSAYNLDFTKSRKPKRSTLALLTLLAASSALCAGYLIASPFAPVSGCRSFTVTTPNDQLVARVADTPSARAAGMMHQTSFAPHDAMIFLYRRPSQPTFWMKDTPLSLDMVFLDDQGRVLSIVYDAPANSETKIRSPLETTAVLELPAGQTVAAGIEPDTILVYSLSECEDHP